MSQPIQFALYVSSVAGHLVTRFGAQGSYVGAERDSSDPTTVVWNEEAIVALTEAEVARYSREYDRLIRGGALRKRTAAEFQRQNSATQQAPAVPAKGD